MRLSTAALLAARFPYVTPSGRVGGGCGYDGSLARRTRQRTFSARTSRQGSRLRRSLRRRRIHRQQRPVSDRLRLADPARVDPRAQPQRRAQRAAPDRADDRRARQPLPEVDQASGPAGGSSAETLIPPRPLRRPTRRSRPTHARPPTGSSTAVHGHDLAGAPPGPDRPARLGALQARAGRPSRRSDQSASR